MPATMSEVPLAPEQVRASRELLGWTPLKLAIRIGVSEKAILAFEASGACSPPLYLDLVRERLEAAGVEFIAENGGGAGVRLRKGAK